MSQGTVSQDRVRREGTALRGAKRMKSGTLPEAIEWPRTFTDPEDAPTKENQQPLKATKRSESLRLPLGGEEVLFQNKLRPRLGINKGGDV
jgi:hypothetical protein